MTERSYLFFVGALILPALYLDNGILFFSFALTLVLERYSGFCPVPIGLQRVGFK